MEEFNKILKNNEELLEKAIELDNEKWGQERSFSNIFESEKIIKFEENKNYLIIYQGEINITKEVCNEALRKNSNIALALNDEYLATNKLIVRIANQVISNNKNKNIIKIYNNVKNDKIFNGSKEFDEVKFIGDKFDYMKIKNKILCKCEFIERKED